MTIVRIGGGAESACGGGCGICASRPLRCGFCSATITMKMMISTSSTSISGVTFICGADAPPPPIDIAIVFSFGDAGRVLWNWTPAFGHQFLDRQNKFPSCGPVQKSRLYISQANLIESEVDLDLPDAGSWGAPGKGAILNAQ